MKIFLWKNRCSDMITETKVVQAGKGLFTWDFLYAPDSLFASRENVTHSLSRAFLLSIHHHEVTGVLATNKAWLTQE